MKLTKNCVKNLTKKILPILCSLLLMFISVFTISIFSPANKVCASGIPNAIANNIKGFLKSVTGVVNKGIDGISDLPQTIDDQVTQYIINNLNGDGIYEDGNGNYVFSNDFMNGFYNILNGNSNVDAYVCSDFSNFNDSISSPYTNTYYNNQVTTLISLAKSKVESNANYSGYICQSFQSKHVPSNTISTYFYVYLIPSDFGFLGINQNGGANQYSIRFYNTNSSNTNVLYGCYGQIYYLSNGSFSDMNNLDMNIGSYTSLFMFRDSQNSYAYANTQNGAYSGFPNYTSSTNGSVNNGTTIFSYMSFFATDAVIIAKDVASGNAYISTNNYIAYNTVNNTDITISKTVIENNNWTNIYNKYVTNVTNEYNEGSDLTRKDVQKIIKKYTDVLLKNIADGIEDLEEKIDDTNEWLDKISRQIDEINAYLEEIANNLDNGVGGDGCAWTEEDITRVKQILERFYLYSDDYLDRLQDIDVNTDNLESDVLAVKTAIDNLKSYLETWKQKIDYIPTIADNTTNTDQKVGNIQTTLVTVSTALNTIISKLDGIGSGSNVDVTIPSIDPDIIDDIVDLTEDKLGDLAGLLDVVGYVLQDAMPFCFVALAGVVVNALSAEPVAPDWVIPLSNSDGSISESMELDLSIFDGIHELWISLITILFVFGLISASFKIFQTFGVLVN